MRLQLTTTRGRTCQCTALPTTSSARKRKRNSLEEELTAKIKKTIEATPTTRLSNAKNIFTSVKNEMTKFESNGYRGPHLTLEYEAILTIPPTSVESERAFSTAGYFCTKIRSRLNDETLNTLCFLRSYFQKLKWMNYLVPNHVSGRILIVSPNKLSH